MFYSKLMIKITNPFKIISFFILILLVSKINTLDIRVYSKTKVLFSCENKIFTFSMTVSFSEKLTKSIPFDLELLTPQFMKLKCILLHTDDKIICTSTIPELELFSKKELYIQFPYRLPEIDDIIWDYNSFISSRRTIIDSSQCNNFARKNFNISNLDFKYWNGLFQINNLENGNCETFYDKTNILSYYYFKMSTSIEDGEIKTLLLEKNYQIELLQSITVLLYNTEPKQQEYQSTSRKGKYWQNYNNDYNYYLFKKYYKFAYCEANEKLTKNNYQNFIFQCKMNTDFQTKFNEKIKIGPFYDKIYIKLINEKNEIIDEKKKLNIFFKPLINENDIKQNMNNSTNENQKKIEYISLSKNGNNIICPDKPIFTISNKNEGIVLENYYRKTQKFFFLLKGTLTNGFKYENNSILYFSESSHEMNYQLTLTDNLADQIDDNEINVNCILSSNTLYNEFNGAVMKCFGTKKNLTRYDFTEKYLDLTLNYKLKKNNDYHDIIIKWPSMPYDTKKNIYSYDMLGISIKQKDYFCDGDNFIFYVFIYNLRIEPKIKFELPLLSPKNYKATCILFDAGTLRCSINLKHNILFSGQLISLPSPGVILDLLNDEGNKNVFTMNNYIHIQNSKDSTITVSTTCGNFISTGVLKDLGLSKDTSMWVNIVGALFVISLVGFCFFFVIYMIKERMTRGKRLITHEEMKVDSKSESKKNEQSNTIGMKT